MEQEHSSTDDIIHPDDIRNMPRNYDSDLFWPPRYLLPDPLGNFTAVLTEEELWKPLSGGLIPVRAGWRDLLRYRERVDGMEKIPFVWEELTWWKSSDIRYQSRPRIYKSKPGMISFFPTMKAAQTLRFTQMSVGRFLRKILPQREYSFATDRWIESMVRWQVDGVKPTSQYDDQDKYPLMFAATPDEIELVYLSQGNDSCMSGNTTWKTDFHPTRVYGAGDFQVAYLHDNKPTGEMRIRARVIVRPETMTYGRVYPSPGAWGTDMFSSMEDSREAAASITSRLRSLGYRPLAENPSGFTGARILRIPATKGDVYPGGSNPTHRMPGYVLMPYIDGNFGVLKAPVSGDSEGKYLVLVPWKNPQSANATCCAGTSGCNRDPTTAYVPPEESWP